MYIQFVGQDKESSAISDLESAKDTAHRIS